MALAAASTVAVEIIPLDRIQANGNLRESLPDIPQLAESIREHGMLTAILVDRRADGDYELVAGFPTELLRSTGFRHRC
jgi:ParB-like chromosome segregation protein Spo0J